MKLVLAVSFSVLSLLSTAAARAEEQVCAAILPCDGAGEVLPEFSSGPCANTYRMACAAYTAKKRDALIASCDLATSEMARKQELLRRKVRALQSRLRAAAK